MICCATTKIPILARRYPQLKLAHFGTFDVENYGDMLFPLILERRLSDLCDRFVHVSPRGVPPPWEDCVETIGFDQFSRHGSDVDGLVLGGGQIIRATPTPLELYNVGGISPFLAYPNLWLGASYIAAREDLPLCWNAPGVPRDFTPVAAEYVRWSIGLTDYAAVRDGTSHAWLQEAGVEHRVEVVPDTAIEVSRLWTEEEISEAYKDAFSRRDRSLPDRTLVCHVNSRWAGEDLAAVAARIDRICRRFDATAVLVAIGPVHGDGEVQRAVAREMNTDPLLIDRPQSLREVAACIAHSEAYLGSSLHGMITACSFGTRALMIASAKDAKYPGFLEHFGLRHWLAESWDEAEQRTDALMASSAETWQGIREAAEPILDSHWSRVREALTRGGAAATGTMQARDKRVELERLRGIGQDRYRDVELFPAYVAESLEINQAQLEMMKRRLAEESRKVLGERRKLREESRKLAEQRTTSYEDLRTRLKTANKETARLVGWIEELEEGLSVLSNSQRWKIWRAFEGPSRRILRKPKGPSAMDHLEAVLDQFRRWRRERPDTSYIESKDEVGR
jgi:polysaccharide pyruvyl transferase WcaK-like protein